MSDGSDAAELLREGDRVGRYVILRDIEGHWYAIAAGAASALRQCEDGTTLLMLPGGKLMHVPHSLPRVLGWFDGKSI